MNEEIEISDKICQYGCGRSARYIMSNGKFCCETLFTKCPAIVEKNKQSILRRYREGRINQKEIYKNKSHESKRRMNWNAGKISLTPEICKTRKYVAAADIIKMIHNKIIDMEYKCSKCGNPGIWQNEKLVLEVHHIDGNHSNNDIANLCLLCPNCHSQTNNFRNKIKGKSHKSPISITKEIINHIAEYNYDIDKFIRSNNFKNKVKVYSAFFELLRNGTINLSYSN